MLDQLRGEPIRMPSSDPVQRPQRVPELAAHMVEVPRRVPSTPLPALAQIRYELLDQLGLNNPITLLRKLEALSDDHAEALLYGVVDLAKATLDRLLEEAASTEGRVTLWAEPHDLQRLVGQTLLFADRYLAPDPLLSALARGNRGSKLVAPIRAMLALRPLVEAGLVVPVADEIATVMTNDAVVAATQADLRRPGLARWVMQQLIIDGPTARSVAFVSARDDLDRGPGAFYLHAKIDGSSIKETGEFGFEALHGYDETFDYQPWLDQCRRQTAAALIQQINKELGIAELFGASFVTRAPFRARLLHRRGNKIEPASALVWTDVPLLPKLRAADLVAISRTDETVEALRSEVRRAFRCVESELSHEAAVGLVEDLARATAQLERRISTERAWGLVLPTGAVIGSAAIAASAGVDALAGAAVGGIGGVAPYVSAIKARRSSPAFAFILARRRLPRSRSGGKNRAKAAR